jgi:hypothetical protein
MSSNQDTLVLGGIAFDGYSTPHAMMGGGAQAMVVHKLPGGARVIDTLGPDEADITWDGFFFGNDSYTTALALDGMRASGSVVALSWGGQYRTVIVKNFIYKVRRLPVWVEYAITLEVYQNPSLGVINAVASSIDTLVLSDIAVALGI